MSTNTEFRRCKCGYNVLVYLETANFRNAYKDVYTFFDGQSGNHEVIYTCPNCYEVLNYSILED
jgi:hypothetical protein